MNFNPKTKELFLEETLCKSTCFALNCF